MKKSNGRVAVKLPEKLNFLFKPYRYKVAYGGRGGAKSWGFARALLVKGAQEKLRILCAREFQKSIKQSVYQTILDQAELLGMSYLLEPTESSIKIPSTGTEFVFSGLAQHTVDSVKSFEGVDITWVEEGQSVSEYSWDILTPTVIRKPNAEIWVSLNPDLDTDETYVRFVTNPPSNSFVQEINWRDNPWFTDELNQERLDCLVRSPKKYPNIWEGKCKTVVDGAIYADEVMDMVSSGRICRVPYEPRLKVHAVFDLGWNDKMAIGFVQRSASEVRIIDYIEDSHKTLEWYSKEMKARDYNWGSVNMPHDADIKDIKTGRGASDFMRDYGWNVNVIPVGSINGGIEKARYMFPRVWIDKDKCARLIECLKRYRRQIPVNTGEPAAPLHDEYSHGADMYRYVAECIDDMRNEAVTTKRTIPYIPQGAGFYG